jgi:hypothetical protein
LEIFISHSSKDKEYGIQLVKMLRSLGVPNNNIVFTSLDGNGIPKGQNIFGWLKGKLTSKPFVIYILSDNYYSSVPCLNEMGAAWVIENNHLIFVLPSFNLDDPRFQSGAIDPREMVVFADKENDIYEFVDIMANELDLRLSSMEVKNIVESYLKTIKLIDINIEKNVEDTVNDEEGNTGVCYKGVINQVVNKRITDEEILLFRYLSDTGGYTLGDRWMADGEIENIKKWEKDNSINDVLSSNYYKALSRFNTRKYLEVESTTSYGNPREYRLASDIAENLIVLDDILRQETDRQLEKYRLNEDEIFF